MKSKKPLIYVGENEKEIIKQVGLGIFTIGFVAGSMIFPTLPMALQPIIKIRGSKGLRKMLKNLEKKRYIVLGGEKIKLTARGRKMLNNIHLSEIEIKKPKEWDGNWYLVAYDIPEKYKKDREWFRNLLLLNGFYQIQKSLFVHPYECKEEIALICEDINILPYVVVMKTDKLPNEAEMIEYFNLKNKN